MSYKAKEMGYKPDLILAARQINSGMGKYIADKTIKEVIKAGKLIKDSEILILGLAFKENCPDTRNTRVTDIISELRDFGANVDVYDPWVDTKQNNLEYSLISDPLKSSKKYDAIVVAVSHKQFKEYSMDDYQGILSGTNVIIDVKNIVKEPTWRL